MLNDDNIDAESDDTDNHYNTNDGMMNRKTDAFKLNGQSSERNPTYRDMSIDHDTNDMPKPNQRDTTKAPLGKPKGLGSKHADKGQSGVVLPK